MAIREWCRWACAIETHDRKIARAALSTSGPISNLLIMCPWRVFAYVCESAAVHPVRGVECLIESNRGGNPTTVTRSRSQPPAPWRIENYTCPRTPMRMYTRCTTFSYFHTVLRKYTVLGKSGSRHGVYNSTLWAAKLSDVSTVVPSS